jgi:hypothetical protein
VYIYCERGDHYVCHEEISIDEEREREWSEQQDDSSGKYR